MPPKILGIFIAWLIFKAIMQLNRKVAESQLTYCQRFKAKKNRSLFKSRRFMRGTPRLCPMHAQLLKLGQAAVIDSANCEQCNTLFKNFNSLRNNLDS